MENSLLDFLVLSLATWRVSHMFVYEAGPFYMFTKIRASRGIQHDLAGEPIAWPMNKLLGCLWCTSVWVGAGMLALFTICQPMVYVFAISAVACLLTKLK